MKSIRFVSHILSVFAVLIAAQYVPVAYSFGVDPGVVSREISNSSPYNNPNYAPQQQPPVIIYQDRSNQQGTIIIDDDTLRRHR